MISWGVLLLVSYFMIATAHFTISSTAASSMLGLEGHDDS